MIYCCYINNAQKLHLLNKTFHPTKVLLRSESLSSMCAKLHTVAASNNRDHLMRSLRYCLFMPHIYGVILRAHPVHGESHIHAMWITHNANGEVATTSPPLYNEPHWSHVLCVKAQPGTTFASWSQQHFVAIGKPERHVRKASHCGSKQQQSSPDERSLSSSTLARTINCLPGSQALLEVTHQDHSIGIILLLLVCTTYILPL